MFIQSSTKLQLEIKEKRYNYSRKENEMIKIMKYERWKMKDERWEMIKKDWYETL